MLKTLFRGLVSLALSAAVLGGVVWLGRFTFDDVRDQPRYKVRLADVECDPPAGMSRGDFLDEVQYLASLPAELPLFDEELPARLAAAFARHPWVEKVERVEICPGNVVRVQLRHRTPVLAVPFGDQVRAVDAAGVLLPGNAPTAGLPVFTGRPSPPRGPAGTPWGDPAVLAAAQKASSVLRH